MRILMHTIGYPPDTRGGTEVHVRDLAEGLVAEGHEVHVSIPAGSPKTAALNGVNLHSSTVEGLDKLIGRIAPDIIHLHPLHADVAKKEIGAINAVVPVVISYHTPTVSCVRGNLLAFGKYPCDGRIERKRCASCIFQQKGLPYWLASLLGRLPALLYVLLGRLSCSLRVKRLSSLLSWPKRILLYKSDFSEMCESSKRIISVCDWLKELLIINGVPDEKISVVRYGRNAKMPMLDVERSSSVTFGYLGRLTDEKGIGVLLNAVEQLAANADYSMEFLCPEFDDPKMDEKSVWVRRIRALERQNGRIVIRESMSPEDVCERIVQWDALIVPSVWMETGPQVVTEAFMVNTPVIGSNRGGIQELVQEGVNGLLFAAGDSKALLQILNDCISDPARLRVMRDDMPAVRSVTDMVEDVISIYERAIDE